MDVLFQFFLWDQSHVTVVWNTRETGDIYKHRENERIKTKLQNINDQTKSDLLSSFANIILCFPLSSFSVKIKQSQPHYNFV